MISKIYLTILYLSILVFAFFYITDYDAKKLSEPLYYIFSILILFLYLNIIGLPIYLIWRYVTI